MPSVPREARVIDLGNHRLGRDDRLFLPWQRNGGVPHETGVDDERRARISWYDSELDLGPAGDLAFRGPLLTDSDLWFYIL